MQKHLGIFDLSLAGKILSGEKTIDARFSKSKIAPYGQISVGDLVYVKLSGKDIIGQFRVKKVYSFEGLGEEEIREIREKYGEEIQASEQFWGEKGDCRYGTLIFIEGVIPLITSPITLTKKDLRGWVVLE